MEKIYENQNVLNHNNELVSDRSAKLDELKKTKARLEFLKTEIKELNGEINRLSDIANGYRIDYNSRRFNNFVDRFKLIKESRYAKKMAKLNMTASIEYLTKKGKKINANKYMSKENRGDVFRSVTLEESLYDAMRKSTSDMADASVQNVVDLNNAINERTNEMAQLRVSIDTNDDMLSSTKEEVRNMKKELYLSMRKYLLLYKEYKKLNRALNRAIDNELDPELKKQR